MEYITAAEAAARWGVTARQVQRLLADGRVKGATKYGRSWMIPADAEKPADPRGGEASVGLAAFRCLYIHKNDVEAAYAACTSDEERILVRAGSAYLSAEPQTTQELLLPIWRDTDDYAVKLASGMLLALAAMSLGDVQLWRDAMAGMATVAVPEAFQMEKELALALPAVSLALFDPVPDWLHRGAFYGLAPELYPTARFVYLKLLYIKWREIDMLAVAEPFLAECRREGVTLYEVYIRLMAASAYLDLGRAELAKEYVDEALAAVGAEEYLSPFIEMRRTVPRLIDASLAERYPERLALLKKQAPMFYDSWTKVYNAVSPRNMAEGLTPREFEACMLTTRGMAVNEASRHMGISRATLKKYLNSAYVKLGITSKEELRKLIHP